MVDKSNRETLTWVWTNIWWSNLYDANDVDLQQKEAPSKNISCKGTRRRKISHNIKSVAVFCFFLFLSIFLETKKLHIYKYSARAQMCSWWNASKRDQFSFKIVFIVFTIHTLNDDDDANQRIKKEPKKKKFYVIQLIWAWLLLIAYYLLIFFHVSRRQFSSEDNNEYEDKGSMCSNYLWIKMMLRLWTVLMDYVSSN